MIKKREKGLALLVSLVVLTVAVLLGLSSYQASQLEERMAGNHRFSISALQAAEAGVNKMLSSVLSYTYSPGSVFCNDMSASLSGTDFSTYEDPGYSYAQSVSGGDLDLRYKALMICNSESGHVLGFSRGVVLGGDGEEVSSRRVRVEIIPPGFDSINTMLGNGITLTGNSTIIGNVHSNTDIDLSLQSTGNPDDRVVSQGTITASGGVNIGGSDAPSEGECTDVVCAVSGSPVRVIPSAQDKIDLAKERLAVLDASINLEYYPYTGTDPTNPDNPPEYDPVLRPVNEYGTYQDVDYPEIEILPHAADGDCNINDPASVFIPEDPGVDDGPGEGNKIYYCPGDLTVTGDFGGVTVMSEGNFTHNGTLSINESSVPPIDTFVVTGGDIVLNGASGTETYGSFLAEGDFVQNGDSKVYGAIVVSGSIIANGGIDYEARETGKILVPVSGRLEGWVELESPSDEGDLTAGEA